MSIICPIFISPVLRHLVCTQSIPRILSFSNSCIQLLVDLVVSLVVIATMVVMVPTVPFSAQSVNGVAHDKSCIQFATVNLLPKT